MSNEKDSPRIVCWFKNGPYSDGEKLEVVFEDPNDDDNYSPLICKDFYDAMKGEKRMSNEETNFAQLNKYGKVEWTAEDVLTLRPDLSVTEAENFLGRNQKHLRDRLIETGWEVMETLIRMDEHIPEEN